MVSHPTNHNVLGSGDSEHTANPYLATMESALLELKNFMKSPGFLRYAKNVHRDIEWKKLGDQLEKHNDDLHKNKINLLEWYVLCQQTTAEIMIKLAQSMATHTTEAVTALPVIKQLSYIVDHIVIAALDMGHFLTNTKHEETPDLKELSQQSWYKDFCDTYRITEVLQDIGDHISRIRNKHGRIDPTLEGKQGVSTIAATVMVVGDLLLLQARFLSGIMAYGFHHAGHAANKAVDESHLPKATTFPMSFALAIIKPLISAFTASEAAALQKMDEFGAVLDEVECAALEAQPSSSLKGQP